MTDAAEFGAALRRERERRGIELETIAEHTKVGTALLVGLERGDLSRWPAGIFRRAFVRAYADAVGLDSTTVLAEFQRVCPEHGAAHVSNRPRAVAFDGADGPLRLTLAEDHGVRGRVIAERAVVAVLDVAFVLGLAAAVNAVVGGGRFWPLLALLALAHFIAGTVAAGMSPAAWLLPRVSRGSAPRASTPATAGEHDEIVTEPDSVRRGQVPTPLRSSRRDRRQTRHERQARLVGEPRAARR